MGSVIRLVTDSLKALAGGLGDPKRDKAAGVYYDDEHLTDEEIVAAYRSAWLPRKIVDIPALDSCRKWRNWQAETDQIEKIEAEEKRLNVRGKVLEALTKARLFGGAAILIGTGDADLMQPLDVERVGAGGVRYLTVFTRRHLTADQLDRDPASEFYLKPMSYTVQAANGCGQIRVHPTRLVVFHGNAAPDEELNPQQGWGDSVLVAVMKAIKNADATAANIASLVFESKIDVVRLPNMSMNMGNAEYRKLLVERFTLAAFLKGNNGTLILDKEEEYDQKTANFATLPDILDRFLQIASGAADIPATRLLGQSPAGLNATGAADMKNYHDRIQAAQELDMTPAMRRLDECLIRSALGSRDPGIWYSWAPLEQMSEREKADILKTTADAARAIAGAGGASPSLIPIEALSDALVNSLTEQGVLPGLEAAVEEWGRLGDQEEDEAEVAASMTPAVEEFRQQQIARDAAPRSLYVRRDVVNKAEIERWAKAQGFTDILPDLHVTIAHSKTPVDWFKVGTSWSPKLEISEGGPRQMERLGDDGRYIALLITANELVWRHREIKEAGADWDWPDYQPHISIQIGGDVDLSKVEPYQGKIVLGPEIFEEVRKD